MFSPVALIKLLKLNKPRTIKVRSQRYFKDRSEPGDELARDTLNKDETVLVEDSPVMRRRFRLVAQRMRIIHTRRTDK